MNTFIIIIICSVNNYSSLRLYCVDILFPNFKLCVAIVTMWAMMQSSATCLISVDLPPILGPVTKTS